MKPSALATVLIRLAALYCIVCGVFSFLAAIGINAYLKSLIDEYGASTTVSGRAGGFDFAASTPGSVFNVQIAYAGLLVIGGVVIYIFSKNIGLLICRHLEHAAAALEQPQPALPDETPAPEAQTPAPEPAESLMPELEEWREEAQDDIKKKVFRIFCVDWPDNKPLVDDVTKFQVELVEGPDTLEVRAGVEAYNEVMYAWFASQK